MVGKVCFVSATLAVFFVETGLVYSQDKPEDEVKVGVRGAWDAYLEAFSDARTDVVARNVYTAPSFRLGARGGKVLMTVDDTKAAFDETHRSLATERYDRSETDKVEICVLNEGAALLTAHFTRYRTDDSVLMRGASAYLFARFGDGWQIVALIGNPREKLISCD